MNSQQTQELIQIMAPHVADPQSVAQGLNDYIAELQGRNQLPNPIPDPAIKTEKVDYSPS